MGIPRPVSRVVGSRDVQRSSPRRRGGAARRLGHKLSVAALAICTAALLPTPAAGAETPDSSQSAFSDLGDAPAEFTAALEALESEGVLEDTGCGDGQFCPDGSIPRWEAAVWLVRVLDGADPAEGLTSRFTDVDATVWWAPHTERLAQLEIANGCATDPARFCPQDPVSRAEMAALLAQAFDAESASPAGFGDTGGHSAADDIDAVHAAGIVAGCSTDPLLYCPDRDATRAEMAGAVHAADTLLGDIDSLGTDTGSASTGTTGTGTDTTNSGSAGTASSAQGAGSSETDPDTGQQPPAETPDSQQPSSSTEDSSETADGPIIDDDGYIVPDRGGEPINADEFARMVLERIVEYLKQQGR